MSSTPRSVVLALGGNALIREGDEGDIERQRQRAEHTFEQVAPLVEAAERVLIVHGNGPQVGNELLRGELAEEELPPLPLDVLVADSQGALGYVLQQVLGDVLRARGREREVVTVVTQVLVSEDDPGFASPSKPIGRFHSKEEADRQRREHGWDVVEDSGRGWRRVVASPRPRAVVEMTSIGRLFEAGVAVIAGGGGGVPVVRRDGRLRGVEAVIDKDHVAALLARALRPDLLLMLTAVGEVCLRFRQPDERALRDVRAAELRAHVQAGEFPAGSMGPKVQAVLDYLGSVGDRALITSPEVLADALEGRRGTWVSA